MHLGRRSTSRLRSTYPARVASAASSTSRTRRDIVVRRFRASARIRRACVAERRTEYTARGPSLPRIRPMGSQEGADRYHLVACLATQEAFDLGGQVRWRLAVGWLIDVGEEPQQAVAEAGAMRAPKRPWHKCRWPSDLATEAEAIEILPTVPGRRHLVRRVERTARSIGDLQVGLDDVARWRSAAGSHLAVSVRHDRSATVMCSTSHAI